MDEMDEFERIIKMEEKLKEELKKDAKFYQAWLDENEIIKTLAKKFYKALSPDFEEENEENEDISEIISEIFEQIDCELARMCCSDMICCCSGPGDAVYIVIYKLSCDKYKLQESYLENLRWHLGANGPDEDDPALFFEIDENGNVKQYN